MFISANSDSDLTKFYDWAEARLRKSRSRLRADELYSTVAVPWLELVSLRSSSEESTWCLRPRTTAMRHNTLGSTESHLNSTHVGQPPLLLSKSRTRMASTLSASGTLKKSAFPSARALMPITRSRQAIRSAATSACASTFAARLYLRRWSTMQSTLR